MGKIANCQAGVFLGYNSSHGYTLLNCRLYIPQEWFSDEYAEKRYKTGLPTDLTFQTKMNWLGSMIEQTHALRCPSAGSLWMKPLAKILICLTALMAKPLTATLLKCPKRLVSGPPAPRPICPHHLDAGAKLPSSASGLVNLRLSPLLNSLTPSRSMSGNSMFSKRAPRASSLLPLLVAALSLSAMGSPVLLSAHRPPQSRLFSAILSLQCTLETSLDDFATVSALRWPIETILNKPSSFRTQRI
ncbi:transposase [Chloroflexi bacterium TSY]|nr:transposase [Chloroflexi bacterium TSY]